MKIRKIRVSDIPKIVRMYNESSNELRKNFDPPVLTTRIGRLVLWISTLFNLKLYTAFVAEESGKIIGFVFHNNYFNSFGIIVKEEYHKKGIGTKLLKRVIDKLDTVVLSVDKGNKKAIKFYEKNGFKKVNEYIEMKLTKKIEEKK